jgi:hypothetical protein
MPDCAHLSGMATVANNLEGGIPDRKQVFDRAGQPTPVEVDALLADLHALGRPASRRDIGEHLLILVGCFPNAKTDDAEIYGRVLAEDVADRQPSLSDLEVTCRNLRRTLDFRPSIHQVLVELDEVKQIRQRHTDRIEYLVKHPECRRQR